VWSETVKRAWNIMQGIEWHALETVAEIVGAEDVALLIDGLLQIRAHQERDHDH
jgi:hypothetical protein